MHQNDSVICICVCIYNYVCVCVLRAVAQSCLTVSPWTVARQTPLSMGFSRQEYWSGLPYPSPGDLPDPGIKPVSPAALGLAGRFFTAEPPRKPVCVCVCVCVCINIYILFYYGFIIGY